MQELPIILLGAGGVGRAFVRQLIETRGLHAEQYGLWLSLLAVCDRDGAVLGLNGRSEHGIDDANLLDILAHKAKGGRLAEHALGGPQNDLAAVIDIAGRSGAVVVDCTASEETAWALLFALQRKYKVVLANKKPLTIDQEVYDRLTRAGDTGDDAGGWPGSRAGKGDVGPGGARGMRQLGRSRWETTCGAALPVVSTLNRLVAAGDTVNKIAGAFSGTLGYVMTGLQDGQPFSAVVREAHRLGYTEPDPRDDLSGLDVARKALILARGLGWRLEMNDVQVRGLYPPEMAGLPVPDFLAALPQLDADFRDRVELAAAEGKVLRYAATIEEGICRVGLTTVAATSPLGRLNGTDNLVEFSTRWYSPNPLVVQGRGAGADVTASGVLADVIELAYTA
jgi:homoserine dehydrogenase